MTDKKVPHSELGDNLRDEVTKLEPGELRNRLEVLAAWADNQVQWFRGFMTGNEALHQQHQKLERQLDAVNELIKPQWRSMDYDRNKLLDDLREAVGMQIASIPEMDEDTEDPPSMLERLKGVIDPSIEEPNRSKVIEAMNAVDLPNGERFMLESEAQAEYKARDILDMFKEYK